MTLCMDKRMSGTSLEILFVFIENNKIPTSKRLLSMTFDIKLSLETILFLFVKKAIVNYMSL